MKKLFWVACVSALVTSFGTVQVQADQTDAIMKAISGKTIVSETAEFKLRKNGRLTGKAGAVKFKGAWTVRDGKFCRTMTEPPEWVGTECQPTKLGDGTVAITGRNGTTVWKIK